MRRIISCERNEIFSKISQEKINFLEFIFSNLNFKLENNNSVNARIKVKEICKKFSISINENKESLSIFLENKLIAEVRLIDFYLFKNSKLEAKLEFEYKSIFNLNNYLKE